MHRLLVLIALLAACGGPTEENGSPNNAAPNNGTANNGTANAAPNNGTANGTPNNATPNNATPNNATPNNVTPNNVTPNNTTPAGTLAEMYPGDEGIEADPAVVWYEDFEQASVDELVARYDDAKRAGLSFSADVAAASSGTQSVVMAAGGGAGSASDLFKRFEPGYQQLYVRYYVKYTDAPYHHSGMWMGGYNPSTAWPNPQAGLQPDGDDRVSVAIEPNGTAAAGPRLDSYLYWRGMRTWKAPGEPTDDGTSFYGNAVLHRESLLRRDDQWQCIEFMVRLNDDPASAAGGEFAVWAEDQLVDEFHDAGPLGYWVRDKFCPADADSASCLDYAPAPGEREVEVLDLRWRSSDALTLNWIWPQNYISQGSGSLQFDDMVVATTRVGCIR